MIASASTLARDCELTCYTVIDIDSVERIRGEALISHCYEMNMRYAE